MARQQERARRTRAAIIKSAAIEFGRLGYAAASLNRILEGSHATKGAMYFHFDSKEDLARAVMDTAVERYKETLDRWTPRTEFEPLEILHGMLDEYALRFETDPVLQAEFRLVIESEHYGTVRLGGGEAWGAATYALIEQAIKGAALRSDVDPQKFLRILAAGLIGQRYLSDIFTNRVDVRERFDEIYRLMLDAMATPEWLARFRAEGWQTSARPEDVISPV